MIRERGLFAHQGRADHGRARGDPFGLEDLSRVTRPHDPYLAAPQVGPRSLARHGALRGIERDPEHARAGPAAGADRADRRTYPAEDARLCRRLPGDRPGGDQARPGARHPARSGRRGGGARTCSRCRMTCRPSRSRQIKAGDRAQPRTAGRGAVRRDRPRAGRRGLDRAGPSRDHDSTAGSRGQGAAPRHRGRDGARHRAPMNGRRRSSRRWAARLARLRPRLTIANFSQWTLRELDLRREAASARARRAYGGRVRASLRPRDRLVAHQRRGADHSNGSTGSRSPTREALMAAGHRSARARRRAWCVPSCSQAISAGFFHADCTRATCSCGPTARSRRSTSASWAGSTAARGCGSPRSSTA